MSEDGSRTDRATPARMYDYYLGGTNHFAADREAAEQVLREAPRTRLLVQENRAFLGRAVRYLVAEAGIRQFIDLGSGLPLYGGVQEVARPIARDVRVVHVDIDPLVRSHATGEGGTAAIEADLCDPEKVLNHPDLHRLIDLDEPCAVLFMAVLHFVTDDRDPHGIVAAYRDATAPGSYVALSHATIPVRDAEAVSRAADVYTTSATAPLILRPLTEVTPLFDGYDLVDPGVTYLQRWRTDEPPPTDPVWIHGGIGCKGVS